MKAKLVLLLFVLLLSHKGYTQGMPVYDNTNFLSLAKSLFESAKQTSQLLKTVDFLKQQKENIQKVNSIVKQVKAVRDITENHQQLFDMVRNDLREILNSPFIKPNEIDNISNAFNAIIETSLDDLDFMQQLLSSNVLNMTDAERLEMLEGQKKRSKEMVAEIGLKAKRYHTIISFRESQAIINNRLTTY